MDTSQATSDHEGERHRSSPTGESRGSRSQRGGSDDARRSSAVEGRITGWGDEAFTDRRPGKSRTYRSFALRLATRGGEQVLQGEGLKEAITECGCRVGDTVTVKRLRMIKVPAYRKENGSPIYKDGQQVMWDKWLWSLMRAA
ncbi:hypothetical protein [Burkholderia ubonensis]|uniref:hypothetical protein n=1 Tax=Burkholderia ubonensis TaxID=101571 RepID=UPI001E4E73D5|nr:hypothetical protein [Burkholderia ubonensis]